MWRWVEHLLYRDEEPEPQLQYCGTDAISQRIRNAIAADEALTADAERRRGEQQAADELAAAEREKILAQNHIDFARDCQIVLRFIDWAESYDDPHVMERFWWSWHRRSECRLVYNSYFYCGNHDADRVHRCGEDVGVTYALWIEWDGRFTVQRAGSRITYGPENWHEEVRAEEYDLMLDEISRIVQNSGHPWQ